uniref:Tf2-1-like SH3-like domain-containing protein n=1 Tax=Kalanchoe fedtschenkoi TaxID=63787 RepID=A0A7N0U7V5_KALFE
MDFISILPKFEGYGIIMVVVDILSKYGTFMPTPLDCTAEKEARFFKNASDGQTKRVNALLELYMRHFVSANQQNWAKLMVGKASYRIELPPTLKKLHPVFHVNYLKPYYGDEVEPVRGESLRALPSILTLFDKGVDHIKSKWVVRKPSVPPRAEYLVF